MVPAHSKNEHEKSGHWSCGTICRIQAVILAKHVWSPERFELISSSSLSILNDCKVTYLILWPSASVVMNRICHQKPLAQLQAHGSDNYHPYDASFPAVTSLSLRKSVVELRIQPHSTTSNEPACSLVFPLWLLSRKAVILSWMWGNFETQSEFIHVSSWAHISKRQMKTFYSCLTLWANEKRDVSSL